MKIVGVAEPIPDRQERFARMYNIPDAQRFPSYENALAIPKFADAILITMPDLLHHPAAIRGLELGYDILLEKPIATSWKHCEEILAQHERFPRIVAICHVLRYTAYFQKLKEIVQSGVLGEVVTIEHLRACRLLASGTQLCPRQLAQPGNLLPDDPVQIVSRPGHHPLADGHPVPFRGVLRLAEAFQERERPRREARSVAPTDARSNASVRIPRSSCT